MRALVTGATGFIGRHLLARISEPVVLSRDVDRARALLGIHEVYRWNPASEVPPSAAFQSIEAVFHLAGDNVAAGRWTSEKKDRVRNSRVDGTRNLVRALEALPRETRPRVLVSASAVGYYGDRGDEIIDERAPAGNDFLAEVCAAWEAASQDAKRCGVRVVNPRIGVVLGHGGALERMLLPFRLGLGGRLGDGRQWMPWIHVDDVVALMLHAASTEALDGPMNTTAPEPVTNLQFTRTLAAALRRPAIFPVPGFALRLAFGEFSEALLASERVVPRRAQEAGYRFAYSRVEDALAAIVCGSASAAL